MYLSLSILHDVDRTKVVEDAVLVDGVFDGVQGDGPLHLLALQRSLEGPFVFFVVLVQDVLHLNTNKGKHRVEKCVCVCDVQRGTSGGDVCDVP